MKIAALTLATVVLSSPALLRAQTAGVVSQSKLESRVASIDAQIAEIQGEIAQVEAVPVAFANALILMNTGNAIQNPTLEQTLQLISERTAKLQAQLIDATQELAMTRAEMKSVPAAFMKAAEAIEYVVLEKINLIQSQIADSQEDAVYMSSAHPIGSGQNLIDRKQALLSRTLAFLTKQKALSLNQDPRPQGE